MNYSVYSLCELESAFESIDKEAFPERVDTLKKELAKRRLQSQSNLIDFEKIQGFAVNDLLESHHKNIDFKDVFFACLCSFGALGFLITLAGVFGSNTVSWNGENVYGLQALLIGSILDVIFVVIQTIFIFTGLYIYKRVSKQYSYNKPIKVDK